MADSLREELLASDETYRRLAHEHATYAQQLDALINQSRLSDAEQLEETKLKKLKLRLKDEMQEIERRHRSSGSSITAA
ncbi:MAG: DUF465 domain-containing protein [Acidobacteriales bacterium]|nr:DUF465 domain-containing protein [Terriglobales bacterium]